MRAFAVCLGFVLIVLVAGCNSVASAAESNDSLVAIDVLLRPDATMVAKAKAVNAALRRDYAAGFALDATHVPHVTLLQCYVRVADIGATVAVIDAVFRRSPPAGLELTATGYFDSRIAEISASGLAIRTMPALASLQQEIAAAAFPLVRHGGTASAFVGTPDNSTISWTAAYVDFFLTKASGSNYRPHVTAGIAHPDFVTHMVSEPFAEFSFKIDGAAIYQLGDIGTARKKLWEWQR